MGVTASKSQESVGILLVGLDAAGKTTLLWKLQKMKALGKDGIQTSFPTLGFSVEEAETQGLRFYEAL